MDYKKLLLHCVAQASLLFIIVSNVVAMDQAIIEDRKYHKTTFKSLGGLPCFDLNGVSASWHKMPKDKQKKVQKKIINYCDEKFLTLFNLATSLPKDLQKLIANQVYNGDDEAIKRFFKDPLVDIIDDYALAHKIFSGEPSNEFPKGFLDDFAEMCRKRSHWNPEIIFGHSKGMVALQLRSRNGDAICDYKTIEAINKLSGGEFDASIQNRYGGFYRFRYTYRDSYTLANFMKYQDKSQWELLPIVLMPFVIKLIQRALFDTQLSAEKMEQIVGKNEKKEMVNAFIQNKFDETGDEQWLPMIRKIEDVKRYRNKLHRIKPFMACFSYGGFYWCNMFLGSGHCYADLMNKALVKKGLGDLFSGIIIVMLVPALVLGSHYLQEKVFDTYIQRPASGMACVTGLYAAAVSLWNVNKMRSPKKGNATIKELAGLLQCKDIEIE